MRRLLGLVLAALAATLLLALSAGQALAKPTQEQRVTELASPTPPGAPSDFRPCGGFEFFGCQIATPLDGRNVVFAATGGPLYRSTQGAVSLASIGPAGESVTVGETGRFSDSRFGTSDNATRFAFRCPDGLCYRSGNTTTVVARPYWDSSGYVKPHVVRLSRDGSRLIYDFESHNGCDCPYLYEYDGTGSHRFPSDANPAENVEIHPEGASADGKRIFFMAPTSLEPEQGDPCSGCWRVYERTESGEIKLISAGQSEAGNAYFRDASADGSHVLFYTDRGLYERSGNTTTRIVSVTCPAPGVCGAEALGRLADDGSVVFDTPQTLVPDDNDTCEPNTEDIIRPCDDIYEYHDGRYTLISTGPQDPNGAFDAHLTGLSADGKHVFFRTTGALVASDRDSCVNYLVSTGCADLYERVKDTTKLVSTGPASPNENYGASFLDASADGRRVLFQTKEPLVASDTDHCQAEYEGGDGEGEYGPGPCTDIYERFGQTTTLVSTGPTDSQDNCLTVQPHTNLVGCPRFIGASQDGRLVYFETVESLVPQDTDGGQNDIYVSGVVSNQCRPKQHGATRVKCWAGSAK